jgi:predicted enzyme related to lactoylglutathione lyase
MRTFPGIVEAMSTLRGLTTVVYVAADVPAASAWYADFLGVEPYFARPSAEAPAYVEFRVGDRLAELGIMDARFATGGQPERQAGQVTYWAVDDVEEAYADLLERGATSHEEPTERGPGFVTASVVDPFGNLLGVMFNQHYLDENA